MNKTIKLNKSFSVVLRPVAANSFYETLIIYIVLQNATVRRTVQNDAFDIVSPWEQKIYSRLLYNKKLVPTDKILKDIKKRYGHWSKLAIHYIWEDIFWKRKTQRIDWLEKEIRL